MRDALHSREVYTLFLVAKGGNVTFYFLHNVISMALSYDQLDTFDKAVTQVVLYRRRRLDYIHQWLDHILDYIVREIMDSAMRGCVGLSFSFECLQQQFPPACGHSPITLKEFLGSIEWIQEMSAVPETWLLKRLKEDHGFYSVHVNTTMGPQDQETGWKLSIYWGSMPHNPKNWDPWHYDPPQ